MKRAIESFAKDQADDWVARLSCGHPQHVRHRPPFVERDWVTTADGRQQMIGSVLECPRCDRLEVPEDWQAYRTTPDFNATSVPAGLLKDHSTKAGVWGELHVLSGDVIYVLTDPIQKTLQLSAGQTAGIPPEALHHVALSSDARFRVRFLKAAAAGTGA